MQGRPEPEKWTPVRALWFALGALCVVLGFIGIVLPVLPTTPFILVAVWAFGKSSPAFAEQLRQHRIFGPYVRDWEQYRAIPVQAKVLACLMMGFAMLYIVWFTPLPWWAEMAAAAVMAAAAAFILTKPSRPL